MCKSISAEGKDDQWYKGVGEGRGNGVYSSLGDSSSCHDDRIERRALLDSDDSSPGRGGTQLFLVSMCCAGF